MTAPKNLRLHLAAWALYLALAAALTWPTVIRPRDYVISEFMDAATAFENLWWFAKACELRVSPWTNPLLDYPDGYSMIFFPMWIPYDLVGLPVVRALGPDGLPIAFNLVCLLAFALAGWAGFLLVRYITNDAGAALVAGAALEALPYRLWNITRWHVSCLELIALLLYFFLRLLRERDRRSAIGFALGAAALAYMSPNYTADLAMGLTLALPLFWFFERDRIHARTLARPLIIAAGLTALLCLPLLIRIGLEIHAQPVPLAQTDAMRIPFSANLLAFVTPGWNLRALGSLGLRFPYPDPALARAHGIGGYELFAGFTVLALALIGLVRDPRRAAPFAILAAVFVALSLGPRLHLGDRTFNPAGPYSWLEPVLPWLRVDRTPARHAALAYVCLTALAGLGLAALRTALPGRRGVAFLLAAGAAIVLEFNQAPLQLSRFPVPAYVSEIKADPVFGSALDLPYLPDLKRIGGYHQMFHGKPLAYQLTSRIDDPRYQAGPLFRWLDRPRLWLRLQGPERSAAVAELRAEMKRRRLRWLVAYPRFMEPQDLAGLDSVLSELGPYDTLVHNDRYRVYRLSAFAH